MERVQTLRDHFGLKSSDSFSLLPLTVAWRNSLIHASRAQPRSSDEVEADLKARAPHFRSLYSNLDVQRMLASFTKGDRPTLKETTTMVAVSQNLARELDRAAILQVVGQPEQVKTLVRSEIARAFRREPRLWKTAWGRDHQARERALLNLLSQIGISDTHDPISASLDLTEVKKIVASSVSELSILPE